MLNALCQLTSAKRRLMLSLGTLPAVKMRPTQIHSSRKTLTSILQNNCQMVQKQKRRSIYWQSSLCTYKTPYIQPSVATLVVNCLQIPRLPSVLTLRVTIMLPFVLVEFAQVFKWTEIAVAKFASNTSRLKIAFKLNLSCQTLNCSYTLYCEAKFKHTTRKNVVGPHVSVS